ncbi:hypothetical protein LEP1GSC059_2000 [Leptospira noguchii serovar Panama str. CZ214]|uniref:Uncharacterized protein n=1 Tax=Leptospira noguchii serovar Panama str. CZ214 TaxID=1001595 RepID=T0FJA5_9LEPT|nr:hypothetical protein LEP1GSC059_2000 [Leptospira noguchii serovar Panama str. CZ214]
MYNLNFCTISIFKTKPYFHRLKKDSKRVFTIKNNVNEKYLSTGYGDCGTRNFFSSWEEKI